MKRSVTIHNISNINTSQCSGSAFKKKKKKLQLLAFSAHTYGTKVNVINNLSRNRSNKFVQTWE